MEIIVSDESYKVYNDWFFLGYMGETNSRTIQMLFPTIWGINDYRLRFEYSDGVIYEIPVKIGEVTINGSLLREVGEIKCQWIAVKPVGDSYEVVAKSNIFKGIIKPSLSDDIAPIPTYEQSRTVLENVLEADSQLSEKLSSAQQAKDDAISAKETAQQLAESISNDKTIISANVESASQVLAEANDIAEIAERELNEVVDAVEEVKGTVAQVRKNTSDISFRLPIGWLVTTGDIQTGALLDTFNGTINTNHQDGFQVVSIDVSNAYRIVVPEHEISKNYGLAWFNADGEYIGRATVAVMSGDENYVPDGAAVAKFNSNAGVECEVTVYLKGATYMELEKRVEELENPDADKILSENLFDLNSSDILHGYDIGGSGTIGVNSKWMVTNYIPVSTGDVLRVLMPTSISTVAGGDENVTPAPIYYQTYDSNKIATNTRDTVPTDRKTYSGDEVGYFTAAADGYVRFTFQDRTSDSPVEKRVIIYKLKDADDTYRPYVKSGYEQPKLNLSKQNIVPTMYNWYGKKWISIGDSNTSRRQYQKYVIDALGLRWSNYAEGGTDASYWADDARLQAIIAESPDVVTIMLGTNNHGTDGIGDLPSASQNITTDYVWDKTTFVGAMMHIISTIQTALPDCLVMLIPPMYASLIGDGVPHEFYEQGVYERYDKLKEIAHRYGCEFIDGHNLISMYNCRQYFDNENGSVQWTHWNDKLGRKLARKIIVRMLESEPM